MSVNIQLLVQLIRSREVLIQVDQSTKDVKDAYDSFVNSFFLFCPLGTLRADGFNING